MRSLFYAMGYTKEELERPLIGVVSAKSEIVPGHMHLDKVADAVKRRRPHGRRHTDRSAIHWRLRWDSHGTCRHEIQSAKQRADRRQRGNHDHGSRIRWSRIGSKLR